MAQQFEIVRWPRGSDLTEDWTFARPDGSPFDLTGSVIRWTVKRHSGEADPGIVQHTSGTGPSIVFAVATQGRATHQVTAAETRLFVAGVAYPWDVQITMADGRVEYPLRGAITFTPTVTGAG